MPASDTPEAVYQETNHRMIKTIEALKQEFVAVRTGRASVAILDTVRVAYYGSTMPINQMASVGVTDVRTLEIKPWDASVLPEIERAILKANLGITPMNDGKIIRLVFPSLNEERRRELVKQVHKIAEEIRVEIRGHRRRAMENLKTMKKEKSLGEDEEKAAEQKIQKMTEEYITRVDENIRHKEQELMEV